jgi:hypothetical protein
VTPERDATVARIVQAAISATPSIATARRTIQDWAGHPGDSSLKADALQLLDRIETEAVQTQDVPATGGAAQEGTT